MNFGQIKSILITTKLYLSRSLGYLSLFNSAVLIFLLLSNLEKYGIDIELRYWTIPLVLLCVCLLILGGWIEDKLGLWKDEQVFVNNRNIHLLEIKETLNDIQQKVSKYENEKR